MEGGEGEWMEQNPEKDERTASINEIWNSNKNNKVDLWHARTNL
jgi:hypothetical protein